MQNLTKFLTIFCLLFFCSFLLSAEGWVKKNVNNGTNHLYSVFFVDADTGYIAGQFGSIYKSTDAGETWNVLSSGVSTDLNSIFFTNSQTGYAAGNEGVILKTTNGGATWNAQISGTTKNLHQVFFVGEGTGYVAKDASAGDPASIIKTVDGGTNWVLTLTGITATFYSIFFTSEAVGYGGGAPPVNQNADLLKTTDGGQKWTALNSNTQAILLSMFFPSADTGYACGSSSIIKTTDAGNIWNPLPAPVTDGRYNSIFFVSNDTGYIAGRRETGNLPLIMMTKDGGISWTEQSLNEVQVLNSIYFPNSQNGYACGNAGLFLKTTNGGVTAVDMVENILPSKYVLRQNYPNPFNPSTKIKFAIPSNVNREKSNVILKVFDVLGNHVATLVNKELSSGEYEVSFNASKLSSGVYFYKLQAGNYFDVKKMILLR